MCPAGSRVWTLGPQLVVLFWKAVEPWNMRTRQQNWGTGERALKVTSGSADSSLLCDLKRCQPAVATPSCHPSHYAFSKHEGPYPLNREPKNALLLYIASVGCFVIGRRKFLEFLANCIYFKAQIVVYTIVFHCEGVKWPLWTANEARDTLYSNMQVCTCGILHTNAIVCMFMCV